MTFSTFFSSFGRSAAVAAAVVLGTAAVASAATFKLTTSFDVGRGPVAPNTFPSDPNGLDGSTFTIESIFADDTTFQRSFAPALSTSATVSGASVASSNGSFTVTDNVGLFQGSTGGGFGRLAGGTFFSFLDGFAVPGIVRSVKLDAGGTVGAQSNGSPVTLALLQGLSFRGIPQQNSASLFSGFQNSNFTISNLQSSAMLVQDVAPVPLPAALPLMLAGLGGFAALRRRRKAAA